MALAGAGAVAIWNDITPEGRTNFYEWHGRQHIPERVGIPGFLTGRRYLAEFGSPEYFTLYETKGVEVLDGEDYLSRLNAPTPWTVSATSHFRNVARSLCRVEQSVGEGVGGLMATWRYEAPEPSETHIPKMKSAVSALGQREGVAGAHLLITDQRASHIDNEERKKRGQPNLVPGWILLVESWGDLKDFQALGLEITQSLFAGRSIDVDYGLYRLQCALLRPPALL